MWRGILIFGFWEAGGGAALTDYFAITRDMNTAMREALNARYTTTNEDFAPLLARFLQQKTAEDSTRAWVSLEAKARGQEAPSA